VRSSADDLREVLVAAARQADEHEFLIHFARARECMSRLERRKDALGAGEVAEGGERLLVRGAHIFGAAGVAEERMLWADARVVEAGRDRVGVEHLAVLVREQ